MIPPFTKSVYWSQAGISGFPTFIAMSRKYKFWDSNKMYFISFATVNWVDVFTRNHYSDIVLDSWKYCQREKGLEIFAWCIMPSHVHMIISSHGSKLEDIIRDMKSFTSRHIRKAIAAHPRESRKEWMKWMFERAGKNNLSNKDWMFWQHNNMPIEITNQEQYFECVHYVHLNPVVAGFVTAAEHWLYSSAGGYEKNNGLIVLTELG
ncbi:MAG: transposase [Chitinophagaceae bacterium]